MPPVRQSASRQAMNGARCDSATQATEESESEMKRKSKTTTAADTEQRRAELYMKKTPKIRPTIFELIFFVFLFFYGAHRPELYHHFDAADTIFV